MLRRGSSTPPASSGRAPRTCRVRRVGLLSGSAAAGSVACFQALETWPSMPPGRVGEQQDRDGRDGQRARTISARVARRRARALGRVDRGEEADGEAGDRQRRRSAGAAAAERLAGVDAHGERGAVRRSGRPARTPTRRAAAVATSTPPSVASAAQPQRHEREPQRRARSPTASSAPRENASSRQTISDAEAGPGEHVERGVAGAARGEPQQRRDAERGGQPDAVPVVERRAQARERSRPARARPGRPSSAATRGRAATTPSAMPPSSALQRPGASRPSASPPASAAR